MSEIRPLIGPDFRILSLDEIGCYDELPETADTLEANSLQKAAYVFDRYGLPCFADDTGLEVAALNGEPGVYSARYAGEQKNSDDNINLLLSRLHLENNRSARFRTIITLIRPDAVKTFEGIIDGQILRGRRGASGFGYDPVFQPLGYNRSLAEMTLEQKNQISHRAIAVRKLVHYLRTEYR